jgi:long-chain fatty acid transport protein
MIGSPALMSFLGLPSTLLDSELSNNGKSFGVGFHAGFMLRFRNDHTRIGFNYQSSVKHTFKGSSILTGRLADPSLNVFNPGAGNAAASFRTNDFKTNVITFPALLTLSGYQDLNEKWALLGSIVYTVWSPIELYALDNLAASSANNLGNINLFQYNSLVPQDYRNTLRYAVGLNYQMNPTLMLRGGRGSDQRPTVNAARNINLPDANVVVFAGGVHYQMYKQFGLDMGYSYYMKAAATSINSNYALGNSTYNINVLTNGYYGHLIALQFVWTGDKGQDK